MLQTPFVEVHEIEGRNGYRCSRHRHLHKSNMFYCVSGSLNVFVAEPQGNGLPDLVDRTYLKPGQATSIAPGKWHWFEGVEDFTAVEIYYPQPIDPGDIERVSVGGQING